MAKKRDQQEFEVEEAALESEDTLQEQVLDSEEDLELAVELSETEIFLTEGEEESEGFLPDVADDEVEEENLDSETLSAADLEGTELDSFESANIEEVEFVEDEQLESILESILFASDRPVGLAQMKLVFKGTNITTQRIRRALDQLAVEFAGGRRGVTLEEVPGGYQLRTKIDNMEFLRRTLKTRQFKLSGPALEVLSIVAYKQPIIKSEVDEIRGVESGHLLRALMEKNLVNFQGKSELPGRPMQYGTTRRFLEIFGLRNIKELPTLSQIDELLPEGIDEESSENKPTLSTITDSMSENLQTVSYSSGEDELLKIQSQLEEISTSTNFFEEEKIRQAEKRDAEKAQTLREALVLGEPVSTRDANWLTKYDEALAAGTTLIRQKEEAKKKQLQDLNKSFDSDQGSENQQSADQVAQESETQQGPDLDDQALDVMASEEMSGMDLEISESEDSDDDSEELPFDGEADDIDSENESFS